MPNGIAINVNLAELFQYLEYRIRDLFGDDKQTVEAREQLEKHIQLEVSRASWVRCIGMEKPLPLYKVYQPARLRTIKKSGLPVKALLGRKVDAAVFAGPGRGKTTLLHWIFLELLKAGRTFPLLFTLRLSDTPDLLHNFVRTLAARSRALQKPGSKAEERIVLLVDGYDEIPGRQRRLVSETLQKFSSLQLGNYILSSRLYYDLIDLRCHSYYIEEFTEDDAREFLWSFLSLYNASVDAKALLGELRSHGFGDFIGSPLMLTLACILKSGPMPTLPKNAVGFIRRALDTLTFRWDEAKGVQRPSLIPLDGDERVRCLMRIAYNMPFLEIGEEQMLRIARDHVLLVGHQEVNVEHLMQEIAQWYGLFVPIDGSSWAFVHKTIQDYLAARFWVESGEFDPKLVREWGAKVAYAACLVPDATATILAGLKSESAGHAVREIFYNKPPFDRQQVARGIVGHLAAFGKRSHVFERPQLLEISTEQDFFAELPDEVIFELLRISAGLARQRHLDLVVGFALAEAMRRRLRIEEYLLAQLRETYGSRWRFVVQRGREPSTFSLEESEWARSEES